MKKRTIIVGALVAAAGLVAVGGLAASGGAPTNPEAGPLPEGVDVVTQQVYDDAYAKFEACMNEGGAELFGKRVKPVCTILRTWPNSSRCTTSATSTSHRSTSGGKFPGRTTPRNSQVPRVPDGHGHRAG